MSDMCKFIFKDKASDFFHKKLSIFFDYFLNDMILNGVSENNNPITSIKFTENPINPTSFYDTLLTLIEYCEPNSVVRLINKNRMESECLFYDFSKIEYFQSLFVVNNIMDWTSKDNFNCQAWTIKTPDLLSINNYWRYEYI